MSLVSTLGESLLHLFVQKVFLNPLALIMKVVGAHAHLFFLCVITQVVPLAPKGYNRGNYKPIFGLQVLAYLQSERALSL